MALLKISCGITGQKLRIERKDPKTLVITKSKIAAIGTLAFMVVFFTFWYGVLFAIKGFEEELNNMSLSPFMWIFWLAPLFSIAEILRSLKV